MKHKWLFIFILSLTLNGFASNAITIASDISSTAKSLFKQKNFAALNKLDDELKNSQSRLPDGRWKLTFIYSDLGKINKSSAEHKWKALLDTADEWIQKTPNHPAPYLAKTEILIRHAWQARGSGLARTVNERQWRLFHARIEKARRVLENSQKVTANHPYRYLKLLTIAKAQSWSTDKFYKLYNSATNSHPTYYYLHFVAASYLQPRWHGSKIALKKFVDNAVEKSKEKEGLTLYARIYWSQLWALKMNTFASGYAEWPKMRQGFNDIMQDYPNSKWNLNAYAYYACMANDWKTTDRLLAKLEQPILDIWESLGYFKFCQNNVEHWKQKMDIESV